jgi:hypothetical protein
VWTTSLDAALRPFGFFAAFFARALGFAFFAPRASRPPPSACATSSRTTSSSRACFLLGAAM